MPHIPIPIGTREQYSGNRQLAYAPFALDLAQHTYIIGASGAGKTHLLQNILIEAIAQGAGVGLLDPHGGSAQHILDAIPPERITDVVYLNFADLAYPLAWNPIASIPPDRQSLVTDGIVRALQNLFGAGWGYQTEHISRNSIAALMAADNTSLLAIPRLLTDDAYLARILRQVTDPVVLAFWYGEYGQWRPDFRKEAIAPLQNKLGALFFSPYVRHALGQVKSKIDLRRLMDKGAIIIARLPKGIMGESPAKLLGALLMTQFQQAALQREDMPIETRIPFHLFLDEFHSFLTDEPEAFSTTLAEARKYKLFLTLSHQLTDQIASEELQQTIFSNAGNLISFRVSAKDARLLADAFADTTPAFTAQHFINLKRGEVIAKLMYDGIPGLSFQGTIAAPNYTRHGRSETIIAQSRERYSTPRALVEARIRRFLPTPSRQRNIRFKVKVKRPQKEAHPTKGRALAKTGTPRIHRRNAALHVARRSSRRRLKA
jgi:hypothetical protein